MESDSYLRTVQFKNAFRGRVHIYFRNGLAEKSCRTRLKSYYDAADVASNLVRRNFLIKRQMSIARIIRNEILWVVTHPRSNSRQPSQIAHSHGGPSQTEHTSDGGVFLMLSRSNATSNWRQLCMMACLLCNTSSEIEVVQHSSDIYVTPMCVCQFFHAKPDLNRSVNNARLAGVVTSCLFHSMDNLHRNQKALINLPI